MNRVSMLRKEAGLSQKELAARLGVQPSVVSKYENGGIQLQEDTLRQLVIIFDGVSADFILGLSDDRKRGTSRATPQIVWDAVALVEGADTLSEENRTLLLDCIKDPEILALAGRFQRLSKKSKRRVVEYMDLLRLADFIFRDEVARAGEDKNLSQYFAVLTNTRSVGVMGDRRTYDYTLALRAVTTSDFMTAGWARIPYPLLDRVSTRIINEVEGISRVTYDITNKPPATVEWE